MFQNGQERKRNLLHRHLQPMDALLLDKTREPAPRRFTLRQDPAFIISFEAMGGGKKATILQMCLRDSY